MRFVSFILTFPSEQGLGSMAKSTHLLGIIIVHTNVMNTVSDINECDEDLDDCAQTCMDAELGYTCSCRSGYRLGNDGHDCYGK